MNNLHWCSLIISCKETVNRLNLKLMSLPGTDIAYSEKLTNQTAYDRLEEFQ